jgi:NADH:ubiquinone oxidoreductase subunit 4 (subunit M)
MKDMVAFEYWSLVPIAVFIAFFGVYPAPMFRLFDYFSFTLAGKALTVGF